MYKLYYINRAKKDAQLIKESNLKSYALLGFYETAK
jgi:hypothetical protein